MKNQLTRVIHNLFAQTARELNVDLAATFDLQDTPDPEKGDFALNASMKLAKKLKKPPMQLAERFVELLSTEKRWFKKVEAVPPGFINLFLGEQAISNAILEFAKEKDHGIGSQEEKQTVVVDYSSVNIAKQMHVGHLRSTVIGDVLARVVEAQGHTVIRQNHLGDWGLPMAMVLWKAIPVMDSINSAGLELETELTLEKLESLYKEAAAECKEDPEAARTCQLLLVKLQTGDEVLLSAWKKLTRLSMKEVYRIYDLLQVKLTPENECGESFYRDSLQNTVDKLRATGKLVESQGAQCVYIDKFKAKDGTPLPVMVQKSDGGFNYTTFDLAAILHRLSTLNADRVIYVTDARQALHFAQFFEVAHVCNWTARNGSMALLEHVPFGTVLGEDNKPLKTRSGQNVKLSELLGEAVERAYSIVEQKNQSLAEDKKRAVANAVGIGAVKYADLSQNRNNDYVFSFDRMLALNGNTAPYLQYAHARICSIFRKAQLSPSTDLATAPQLSTPVERALSVSLMKFPHVVEIVARDLRPHILCNYLYDLATTFSSFYDQCPVISAQDNETKTARLFLCTVTRSVIRHGLDLLGIEAPEEM